MQVARDVVFSSKIDLAQIIRTTNTAETLNCADEMVFNILEQLNLTDLLDTFDFTNSNYKSDILIPLRIHKGNYQYNRHRLNLDKNIEPVKGTF